MLFSMKSLCQQFGSSFCIHMLHHSEMNVISITKLTKSRDPSDFYEWRSSKKFWYNRLFVEACYTRYTRTLSQFMFAHDTVAYSSSIYNVFMYFREI